MESTDQKNQVEKSVELMERALAIGLEDGFLRLFLDRHLLE
jgi:hypothetical protein